MNHNIYIYILVMAAVSYLIRMLPLTLIRKEIKNKNDPFLFILCAVCDPGGHDVSVYFVGDQQYLVCMGSFDRGNRDGVVRTESVAGGSRRLCDRVYSGNVFIKITLGKFF